MFQLVGLLLFSFVVAVSGEVRTIYVNPLDGLDTNSGAAAHPLKTAAAAMNAAMDNRRLGIPTAIILRAGVYRETIRLTGRGRRMHREIALKAEKIGTAIITGSDLWSDWQEDSSVLSRYSHPWPYKWGTCAVPAGWPAIATVGAPARNDPRRRRAAYTGALAAGDARLYVLYRRVHGRVYIWPPTGVVLSKAQVEVAVRPVLFESNGNSHLTLSGLVSGARQLLHQHQAWSCRNGLWRLGGADRRHSLPLE